MRHGNYGDGGALQKDLAQQIEVGKTWTLPTRNPVTSMQACQIVPLQNHHKTKPQECYKICHNEEEDDSGPLSSPSGDQKAAVMQAEKLSGLTHKKLTGLGKSESRGLKHRFGAPIPLFSYYTNLKRGQMPTIMQKFLHSRYLFLSSL